MSFGDYNDIEKVVEEFGLDFQTEDDLFPNVEPIFPGPVLSFYLGTPAKWALTQQTGDARRQGIISPFLYEAATRATEPTVVFVAKSFHVNEKLTGYPDYILCRGKNTPRIEAPVLAVVEAKRDDFISGAGQCAAEMVAAREFHIAKKMPPRSVFGCVTNGSDWAFYRLDGNCLKQNAMPLYLVQPERILGILIAIASGNC